MKRLDYILVIGACIALGAFFYVIGDTQLANRFFDIILVFFGMLLTGEKQTTDKEALALQEFINDSK